MGGSLSNVVRALINTFECYSEIGGVSIEEISSNFHEINPPLIALPKTQVSGALGGIIHGYHVAHQGLDLLAQELSSKNTAHRAML